MAESSFPQDMREKIERRKAGNPVKYGLSSDEDIAREIEEEEKSRKEDGESSDDSCGTSLPRSPEAALLVKKWEEFYLEVFGWKRDFSKVKIPPKKEGFDRLIIVARGVKLPVLYAILQSYVPVTNKNQLFDMDAVKSVRKTDQDYAIWARDGIECDENMREKTANEIVRSGITAMTLEERLILGLQFLQEEGRHIDVLWSTICTGSAVKQGDNQIWVPVVYWDKAIIISNVNFDQKLPSQDASSSSDRFGARQEKSRNGTREVVYGED